MWCLAPEVYVNPSLKDPQTQRISDFFSFYSLPSTVINSTKYPVLEGAYLYYYGTETAFLPGAEEDKTLQKRLMSLIGDALVVAKEAGFDVFNALTLMDNVSVLKELKVCPIVSSASPRIQALYSLLKETDSSTSTCIIGGQVH